MWKRRWLAGVAVGVLFLGVLAATPATADQAVYLGYETDACGGVLWVKNRYDNWIKIERGPTAKVDVAIDGDGYWRWKCGDTLERSRGASSYRNRVKRLNVTHSTKGRTIIWGCFDLLK